jgi:hypothetical protein
MGTVSCATPALRVVHECTCISSLYPLLSGLSVLGAWQRFQELAHVRCIHSLPLQLAVLSLAHAPASAPSACSCKIVGPVRLAGASWCSHALWATPAWLCRLAPVCPACPLWWSAAGQGLLQAACHSVAWQTPVVLCCARCCMADACCALPCQVHP